MRKVLVTVPILLGGCAAAAPVSVIHGDTPGHVCMSEGLDGFVGKARSESTGAAIKNASRAAVLRWAPVGEMLTMDYRSDRVTVHLDAANKVTQINCG